MLKSENKTLRAFKAGTCTPVYTEYNEDYDTFYASALRDVEEAKETREYRMDMANHPNWFDASYISWLSYDPLHIGLDNSHMFLLRLSTGENTGKKTADSLCL